VYLLEIPSPSPINVVESVGDFGHSTEEHRDQKKEPKGTSGGKDEKRGS
jgi:hypothetical protein